jgi:D-ribose pyranose/furanose isomerase RbsD
MVAPVKAIPVGAVVVSVPPQTVEVPFATVKPVGSVSVKATPVSGSTFAAGFVIVKVSEVVAFSAIVEGLNAFAMDGGASTWTVAVAELPVPPSVEVTALVVLTCAPAAVPVTFTENVQELLAAIVPPVRLIEFEPAVAVIVPAPHVPVRPFGVETTRPAGSVSVKATPVRATVVFGLVTVKLSEVEPFSGMLAAPKTFAMVGGATTVMEALEVLPVPPLVEVTWTLLFFTPAVVPWTFTETVQLAPGASDAPLKPTEEEPAVAVAVPLQVVFRLFGVATTSPAGKLSVKATPFRVRFTLVLLTVNVSEVVPFSGIVAAPNALAIVGGLMTVKLADEVLPLPASVERIDTLLV